MFSAAARSALRSSSDRTGMRLYVFMDSAASLEFAENHSLQRERWRSVPVSARRRRSPSVTIPTSCPLLSTTPRRFIAGFNW